MTRRDRLEPLAAARFPAIPDEAPLPRADATSADATPEPDAETTARIASGEFFANPADPP